MFEGAIVGTLRITVEAAGGKLTHLEMILQAVAADPLAATWVIGTAAPIKILFLLAFHRIRFSCFLFFYHRPVEGVGVV